MHDQLLSKKTIRAQSEIAELKQKIAQLEAEAEKPVDLSNPEQSADAIVRAEYDCKKLKLILIAKESNLVPMLVSDYQAALKTLSSQEADFNKQIGGLDVKIKEFEKKIESLKAEQAGIRRQRDGLNYTRKSLTDEIMILKAGKIEPEVICKFNKTVDPRPGPRPQPAEKPLDPCIVTKRETEMRTLHLP